MINVDNKVKNIYYMLCFSFFGEFLKEKDEAKLGSEAFANIYNLFSLLLVLLLQKQIKKGLYKDYVTKTEALARIRGRINLNESIKNRTLVNKKLICEFDEFEENCALNKIINTTLYYLIKSQKIGKSTKEKLIAIRKYYLNVDIIYDIRIMPWHKVKFNRNNIAYKYIYDLCYLILNELIVSHTNGSIDYKEFLDDKKVYQIFENFVRTYYKVYYPKLNAHSSKLKPSKGYNEYVPIMKTDITLEYENRILVIDTKFYSKILVSNPKYKSKIIRNDHINQVYLYVDTLDPYKTHNVSGMLLYAQTIDEPEISFEFPINNHRMIIRTLDMNAKWQDIEKRLNKIAISFQNNNWD